ncbi:MAG: methionyl-tRNA formyltransferase [Verrucomicrobia bacterium]|nr:MAG: methionyl-tRNA formyltransferase [Verrucomicrobiota bacterium]
MTEPDAAARRMRVVFMGTGEIGVPAFRWLLAAPECEVVAAVSQPDKPAGRKLELRASAIKQLAVERGVPVLQPVRMRAPDAVAEIVALQADVIVVMAYGQILPKAVLEAARLACLNLHASLLPRWRGAAPIQAAIEAGDQASGVTVMYMAEGLDTGDILLLRATPIGRRETGGSLHDRLGVIAAEALAEAWPLLAAGCAPRFPQDETQTNYAPKLARENGAIDWAATPREIDRRIRAMNPWPAAHTFLPTPDGPRQLKVFSCIQHRRESGPAGGVLRADRRGLLVGAGTGAVLLREVQMEGKKRMPAGEFLRGHPVAVGTLLGAR